VLLGGGGVVLLLLARFFPWDGLPTLCTFRNVTGHPCPGCGMTRSWVLMSKLQFVEAATMNPFGVVLFVCTLLGVVYLGLRIFADIPAIRLSAGPALRVAFWILMGVSLAASWVYTWVSGSPLGD